jgi:hypothetical protein
MIEIRVFIESGVGPFSLEVETAVQAHDKLHDLYNHGFVRETSPPAYEITIYPPWTIQKIEMRPDTPEEIPQI